MMNFSYKNTLGETIAFDDFPYRINPEPLLDYEWDYDISAVGNTRSRLRKISRMSKEIITEIFIHADKQEDVIEATNRFFEIVEYDVINKSPGKLYLNDNQYIMCYVVSSCNTEWNKGIRLNRKEIKLLFPSPFWISELSRVFNSYGEVGSDTGLDYPYDYLYDYALSPSGYQEWDTRHYAPSNFMMNIYGPCSNPRVSVNGHGYKVNVTVADGEHIEIDSRNNTVTLVSGTSRNNIYALRDTEQSVFEPMPGGKLRVLWNGEFGFTIKLFIERSEPLWK